jgi:glycosyltransferase involved in cell wall biosynthesis
MTQASLSVAIITCNEAVNIERTLASIAWANEILVVDSGSTDGTIEIARNHGAKVLVEQWRGFAPQKNFAIRHCTSDWILSLDADEELSPQLAAEIRELLKAPKADAYFIPRRNFFLGRWIRHGGYYPDPKLRLFRRGTATFAERVVHETMQTTAPTATLHNDLLHHAYQTLTSYIEHMNRYSTLGAQAITAHGKPRGLLWNALIAPFATFIYNYIFRLGFLDGREGLLLHLYHSAYVSWKYAKAWDNMRST